MDMLFYIFNIVGAVSLFVVATMAAIGIVAASIYGIISGRGGKVAVVALLTAVVGNSVMALDMSSAPWFAWNADCGMLTNVCANVLVAGGCVTLAFLAAEALEWFALYRRIVRLESEVNDLR